MDRPVRFAGTECDAANLTGLFYAAKNFTKLLLAMGKNVSSTG
jgi:hypothetical protein